MKGHFRYFLLEGKACTKRFATSCVYTYLPSEAVKYFTYIGLNTMGLEIKKSYENKSFRPRYAL